MLTDPSVALILMMIGIYGLIFELANPGMALPGVLGGICLLLGLYALQMLPVNYAGLALIALGLAFMVGEAFVASFGVLGIGGIVSFVVGALILIDTEVPGYGIPPGLVVALALLSAALIVGLLGMALRTRRQAVVSGTAGLVGSLATVAAVDSEQPCAGWVQLQGERWRVLAARPLAVGQPVWVLARRACSWKSRWPMKEVDDGYFLWFGDVAGVPRAAAVQRAAHPPRVRARRGVPARAVLEGQGAGAGAGDPGDPADGAHRPAHHRPRRCRRRM